jgi:hypothetical protein
LLSGSNWHVSSGNKGVRLSKPELESSSMSVLDLIKATVVCGGIAFLVYSFPVIGQVVIIGLLGLAWLTYAHKMIKTLTGR